MLLLTGSICSAISRSVSTGSATSRLRRGDSASALALFETGPGDRAAARRGRSGRSGASAGRRAEPRHDRRNAAHRQRHRGGARSVSGGSENRPRARQTRSRTMSSGRSTSSSASTGWPGPAKDRRRRRRWSRLWASPSNSSGTAIFQARKNRSRGSCGPCWPKRSRRRSKPSVCRTPPPRLDLARGRPQFPPQF